MKGPKTRVTFYSENLHVVSHLTGTMLRGRWEGMVEAIDADGRISHARFDNGKLMEPWMEGHAPEEKAKPAPAPAKPEVEAPKPSPEPERWNEPAALPHGKPAPTPRGAQSTPLPKKETKPVVETPRSVQSEMAHSAPSQAPLPTQSQAPRLPRHDDAPSLSAKSAFDVPVFETPVAPPPPSTSLAPPRTVTTSKAATSTPPRPTAAPVRTDSSSSLLTAPVSSGTGGGDLFQSLAAPPSMLKHRATLTPREAAKIAEVELAKEGYILADYPRRQISYDSDSDSWVFSYAHDPANTAAAGPPQFGVTVEDKTARATIRSAP